MESSIMAELNLARFSTSFVWLFEMCFCCLSGFLRKIWEWQMFL